LSTDDETPNAPGSAWTAPPAAVGPKKPWWRRWWAIALGVFLVLMFIVAVAGGGDDDADDEPREAAREASTTTERPTTTTTSPPTTTAAPTTTTIPAPKVYDGTGTQVLQIENPSGTGEFAIVTLTHNGSSNFAVWSLDDDLSQVDLLVNTIGSYSGTRPINFDGGNVAGLEIEADGMWHIEVKPLDAARRFDASIDGGGDDVVVYTGDAGVAQLSHQGDGNFAIWYHSSSDTDLLVNEIGAFAGSVPLRAPPGVLDITANGPWAISVG
jgi:hypothetical protein